MSKRCLTLQEAVALLETLSDSDLEDVDICQLEPDEPGDITDEEDIDENNLSTVTPFDVCGMVDVILKKDASTPNEEEFQKPGPSAKKKRKTENPIVKWKKKVNFDNLTDLEKPVPIMCKFPELVNCTPLDIFHKFFPEEYVEYLADMTALYALQKGETIDVCKNDILQFFGLLLLSGYHSVPTEDMYWSSAEDTCVPIVPTVMPRTRFRNIKKFFHVMDNNKLEKGDKLGKISPIYKELSKNLQQFGIWHEKLSIDESMVPYYGRHSCKMFIRGKPIRFGFKVWMLCSSTGYPYAMDIYSGKKSESDNCISGQLGPRVVNELLSVVGDNSQHEVYFDNFFTSYKLLLELSHKGMRATGTIRENRTQKCPLKSKKELTKEDRGSFDFRSDGSVYICSWNDNAVVTVASNCYTHEPIGSVKRYSCAKKGNIEVPRPNLIKKYNEGMGGVDVLDKLLSSYRPQLRSKKWWWNLFSNALNMAVVASWNLHCEVHSNSEKISHLEFRRQLTMHLLRKKERLPKHPGPRSHLKIELRQSDGHYLISTSQGRCVVCKKNTIKKCFQCEKRLHGKCFLSYHSR